MVTVNNNSKQQQQTAASPLSELLEHDPIGKPLPADPNALQHAVTPELLQNQVRVHLPRLQDTQQQLRSIRPCDPDLTWI